jgi:hypothetical protein
MKRLDTRLPVKPDHLQRLTQYCQEYFTNISPIVNDNRKARKRFAGDSPWGLDGIRRTSTNGERVKPFKGAANNTVRWADCVVDCERSLILELARKADRCVKSLSGDDADTRRAAALTRLLDWALSYMGGEWTRQLTLAINYMLIDTPAVSLLSFDWAKRKVIAPRVVYRKPTFDAIVRLQQNPHLQDDLLTQLEQDAPSEEVIKLASGVLGCSLATARKVIHALSVDESVEYAAIVSVDEGPSVRAWQYASEFLIPSACADFNFCSPWFRTEWVTLPKLYDLAEANDWSEEFVEACIQVKGQQLYCFDSDAQSVRDERRDMVQLVWAYTIEETADGEIGRWQTIFSAAPNVTACGKELLRGGSGHWSAVFLARERNSDHLLDSRGVAMLASASMDLAKRLEDVGSNNAIIGGLPPVVVKGDNAANVSLSPLSVVKLRNNSELKYLQPPAYPSQGNAELSRIKDELLDYFGIATKISDPESITIRRRSRMSAMIDLLREVYTALLSCVQANISDTLLAQVLGPAAQDPMLRHDIAGHFRLTLDCNVEDLITKNVIDKIQAFGQIVGTLDRNRQVDTTAILKTAVRSLFPDVQEDALRSVTQAVDEDLKNEQENFVKIKAGLKPQMNVQGGWNYAVRLQFWQEQLQNNPGAFEEMSPEAQAFAQQWMQALQQQDQQFGANAELGRTGAPEVQPMA